MFSRDCGSTLYINSIWFCENTNGSYEIFGVLWDLLAIFQPTLQDSVNVGTKRYRQYLISYTGDGVHPKSEVPLLHYLGSQNTAGGK